MATKRPGFLADAMVADLARWLRILGEDCLWAPPDWKDDRVLDVAREDDRVLVSRDGQLVERARAAGLRGFVVPQGKPETALASLYAAMGLRPVQEGLATRCAMCNGLLEETDGDQAAARARGAGKQAPLEAVLDRHEVFWSCMVCHQAYWRGTHWDQIERVRRRLLERLGVPGNRQSAH